MQTVNSVISAVCARLREAFSYAVYVEPVRQQFAPPCFFVRADHIKLKKRIGARYEHSFTVTVEYISPAKGDRRADAADTAQRLFLLFETLTADGETYRCFHPAAHNGAIARGYNRGFETTDEMICFSFDIRYFTLKQTAADPDTSAPPMETAETEIHMNKSD
ncbi:MAG: hypothetical protein IJ766_01235 [Clostridia bacterium]|nr:hypothetical protein [Clostridia bacterium]